MDIQSSTAITVDGVECIEYLFTLVQIFTLHHFFSQFLIINNLPFFTFAIG